MGKVKVQVSQSRCSQHLLGWWFYYWHRALDLDSALRVAAVVGFQSAFHSEAFLGILVPCDAEVEV